MIECAKGDWWWGGGGGVGEGCGTCRTSVLEKIEVDTFETNLYNNSCHICYDIF